MAELSEKHKLFCIEYVKQKFNASKAYASVYPDADVQGSRASASRLLAKPEIKEYLDTYVKELYSQQMLSAETIALELLEMARADKGDEHYSAATKLKAIELLQKQLGLQTQHINANVNQDVNININIIDEDDNDGN